MLETADSTPRGWLRDPRVIAAMIAAGLAILVYANALANGFAYDDVPVIVDNPAVSGGIHPLRILFTPYWPGADGRTLGLYRPLTILLFAVQWALGDGSALVFHAVSLLLHGVATALVFRLVSRFVDWRYALAGTLLFAVHPVHVEAVANVVGQSELMSACLLLAGASIHAGRPLGGEEPAGHRRVIALLFAAGLLAKESAIVFPALLLVLDLAQGRVRRPGYLRSVARLAILLAATTAVYLALRTVVLGALTGDVTFTMRFLEDPVTRLSTALTVWPHYARLLFAPLHLSAMYDPDFLVPASTLTARSLAGAAILAITVVLAVTPRWWPAAGLGASWFLVTILLVSNLVVPVGTLLAERTLYLPSVALAFWIGFGARALARHRSVSKWVRPAAAALGVVLCAFALRTVLRTPVWKDSATVIETSFRQHPEDFRAQWFHAERVAEAGDSTGSLVFWRQAFDIYPDHPRFLTAYASMLLALGRVDQADSMIQRARSLHPDGAESIFLQGLVDLELGRDGAAAARIDRLDALGYGTMARALADSAGRRR